MGSAKETIAMSDAPSLQTVNPATSQPGKRSDSHTPQQAIEMVRRGHEAFGAWRRTNFAERGKAMREAARVLRARSAEFAQLMTDEMGKVRTEALAEVEKCAANCEFFAEHAQSYLA